MKAPPVPRPRPEPNDSPPFICADHCYTREEFCKRLRWKRHSWRQAVRSGLKTHLFGSRLYVFGDEGMDYLRSRGPQGDVPDA